MLIIRQICKAMLYIEEMYLKRNLIAITATFNAKGYNDSQNVFRLIDGLENALFELVAKLTNGKEAKIDVPYYNVIKSIEAVKEGAEPGIMTYISDVDNHIRALSRATYYCSRRPTWVSPLS